MNSDDDLLIQRYREASARENAQPSPRVRAAVLAAARAEAGAKLERRPAPTQRRAANDAQWRWRIAASLAVIGITGVLSYQFLFPAIEQTESDALLSPPVPAPQAKVAAAPAAEPAPMAKAAPDAAPATVNTAPAAAPARVAPPRVAAAPKTSAAQPAPAEAVPTPFPAPMAMPAPAAAMPEMQAEAQTADRERKAAAAPMRAEAAGRALSRSAPAPAAPRVGDMTDSMRKGMAEVRLYAALRSGDAAALRAALQQGASANAMQNGTPILIEAVRKNQLEIVKALLLAGARVDARDGDGQTALDYAEAQGDAVLIELLKDAAAWRR